MILGFGKCFTSPNTLVYLRAERALVEVLFFLGQKYWTWVKMFDKDKHTSLLEVRKSYTEVLYFFSQ
jgi:hypothetical protein